MHNFIKQQLTPELQHWSFNTGISVILFLQEPQLPHNLTASQRNYLTSSQRNYLTTLQRNVNTGASTPERQHSAHLESSTPHLESVGALDLVGAPQVVGGSLSQFSFINLHSSYFTHVAYT